MTHEQRLTTLESELKRLRRINQGYAFLLLSCLLITLFSCSPQRELLLPGGATRNEVKLSADGLVFKDPRGKVIAEFSPTSLLLGHGTSSSARLDCGASGANFTLFDGEEVRTALWSNKDEVQFSIHDEGDRLVSLVADKKATSLSLHQKKGDSVMLHCEGGEATIFPKR